ncbi:chromate transporter [Paenibacillus turpanensis]|uniref:chromate transporter n=1 Tax=Paenibacillus turpanensis TaxID=2689078 RepID=UPI00140916AD|nr:chromate transporter [Paenibacillus turpanensis]
MLELWKLFWSFGTATLLGYGGGPSIIPLYETQVVDKYKWMTTEEFGSTLAFANAFPGPIATKLAAFIGFKVAGWGGAAAALTAVVLPTALLMIALSGVLHRLEANPVVKGMVRGIQPVIFIMLAMLAFDFVKYAFAPVQGAVPYLPFLIAAAFFIMVHYLQLPAVWGIMGALVVGALFLRP